MCDKIEFMKITCKEIATTVFLTPLYAVVLIVLAMVWISRKADCGLRKLAYYEEEG